MRRPIGCPARGSRPEDVTLDDPKETLLAIIGPGIERNGRRDERGGAQIDRLRPSKRLSALVSGGPTLNARDGHVRKRCARVVGGSGCPQQSRSRFSDHIGERAPPCIDHGAERRRLCGMAEGLDATEGTGHRAKRGEAADQVPGSTRVRFSHRAKKTKGDVEVRGSENTYTRWRSRRRSQPIHLHRERDEPIRGHPASLGSTLTGCESSCPLRKRSASP